jgi:hypothetical protein
MTSSPIFLLYPCLNNYEIVAGKVIEIYLRNSSKVPKDQKIKTFFNDTPFALFSTQMNPGNFVIGSKNSKQVQLFIIILGLLAVSMSRINSADFIVNIDNGVVDIAGFSSLTTAASMLNKPVVLWNDDMRSTWGTSNDPLTIGSVPNFFKNLYGAPTAQQKFSPWIKNMGNSSNSPHMGKNVPCPPGNIFNVMIPDAKASVNGNKVTLPPSYFATLITLGDRLIDYVENTKTSGGKGWDLSKNPGLYYDLYFIINKNTGILPKVQQNFLNNVTANPFNLLPPNLTAIQSLDRINRMNKVIFNSAQKYQSLLRDTMKNTNNKNNAQKIFNLVKSIANGGN